MESRHYLRHDPGAKSYRLGSRIWELAQAHHELEDLRALIKPLMNEVVGRTGETVQLATLEGSRAVYLDLSESPHPVKLTSRAGARLPAHTSAIGKALLADLDPDEARPAPRRRRARTADRPHDHRGPGADQGLDDVAAGLQRRQRGVRDRAALHRDADPRRRSQGGRGDLGVDADPSLHRAAARNARTALAETAAATAAERLAGMGGP